MRLIDADELAENFKEVDANGVNLILDRYALKCIATAPTVEARKKGKWIIQESQIKGMYNHKCSQCATIMMTAPTRKPKYKYCPTCGAVMDLRL